MISKELLSEVLNKEVIEINWIDGDNILWFNDYENSINIYELAHKCKEWAWAKEYILTSKKSFFGEWSCRIHNKLESEATNPKLLKLKLSNTEPEAIFKACEWILKEK